MLINPSTTFSRNFFSFESTKHELCNLNVLFVIHKLMTEKNVFLSRKLTENLLFSSDITAVDNIINVLLKEMYGNFLNLTFATENELDEGNIIVDLVQQINEYASTYLGFNLFELSLNRLDFIENDFDYKKSEKVNKYITYKTIDEFIVFVEDMIYMPIVFGIEQKIFIAEAFEKNLIQINKSIKIKENLFYLMQYIENKEDYLNTANDVMRYALYVSNIEFKRMNFKNEQFHLSTSHKRIIMSSLNKFNFKVAFNEMYTKRSLWLSLAKNLYPGSKKFSKFNSAQKLFDNLRDKTNKNKRYNHILGEAKKNNFLLYIEMLAQKPGIMLRSLDEILRNSSKSEFKYFLNILENLDFNPKLVIEQINRLNWRKNNTINKRSINIGHKVISVEKELPELKTRRVDRTISILELHLRKALLGKDLFLDKEISINDDLKSYLVPSELRDNSKTDNGVIYTSGSRIKIPDEVKFLRMFVAWGVDGDYNPKEYHHFDIDHSLLAIHDKDGVLSTSHISFYNQKENYAVSSGDRTQCHAYNPKKDSVMVAEFIDIDIQKCLDNSIIDIIMSNYIYSGFNGESFNDVHAYAGIMFLDELRKEETMTIDLDSSFWKIKLSGDFSSHVPMSLDLQKKDIVIIDQYFKENSGSNIERMSNDVKIFKDKYINAIDTKYNMYDLLTIYCEENNIEINDDAELKLSTKNISNYLEKIVGILS